MLSRPPGRETFIRPQKRGFGVSKWNGFGGKIEAGENSCNCAVRELREETGLIARGEDLELVGFLDFHFSASPDLDHIGFVYFLRQWQGTVQETEEMEPQWFDPAALPYDEMWKGDRTWIPMLLKKKKSKASLPLLKTMNMYNIWNCILCLVHDAERKKTDGKFRLYTRFTAACVIIKSARI